MSKKPRPTHRRRTRPRTEDVGGQLATERVGEIAKRLAVAVHCLSFATPGPGLETMVDGGTVILADCLRALKHLHRQLLDIEAMEGAQ